MDFLELANAFIERRNRPATLDEAEQVIDALWRLLQACREQRELNFSNSSLPIAYASLRNCH